MKRHWYSHALPQFERSFGAAVVWALLWAACLGFALPATAQRIATARSGEGIYSLLQRNGLSGEDHFQAFLELNRGKLGPNNTLYRGQTYLLPGSTASVTEPLFGPKLATVKVLDHRLGDAVFYLVSGHGGPDPGGIGRMGGQRLYEDEYAYDVTLRLGRRLMEHGARVYFIIRDPTSRISDDRILPGNKTEVCYPNQPIPLNQVARLRQRAQAVNQLYQRHPEAKYKRCIVIHVDARKQREQIDIFFYHHPSSRVGQRLAQTMRNTMEAKYRHYQPTRGYRGTVSPRNLYMITGTDPPSVFIELGNIHHAGDQIRLVEPNNRQALANWLCEGILQDHGG